MMVTFEDPFERLLGYAADTWGICAHVYFVAPHELSSYRGPLLSLLKQPKGETRWTDNGGPALILINVQLRRGVQGTLDILAHELAHVAAGFDAGHGPAWRSKYDELYTIACMCPSTLRECGSGS